MQILFLSPRQCWPTTSGARLREFHLARALGKEYRLTYLFFKDTEEPEPRAADLPFCAELIPVPKPKSYTPLKIVRGTLGRKPLSLINYSSPAMKLQVRRVAAARRFDLVHVDSIHMALYVSALPTGLQSRVIFNWHNIESELMERYATNSPSVWRRAYARLTARRLAAVERQALHTALGHLVCSEREQAKLRQLSPGARIAVIENGVDTKAFAAAARSPRPGRFRLLFVGSMGYHANIDAVLWFAERVWPELRRHFPAWVFTIAGSTPAAAVRALTIQDGIEVTGTVPDLAPYYGEAIAAIVPLQTGGGTRLKILEAMAAGVPVISTRLGAEGLAVVSGKDYLLAGEPAEWTAACTSLNSSHDLWNSLAQAGLQLARSRYDWDVLGSRLRAVYQQWLSE